MPGKKDWPPEGAQENSFQPKLGQVFIKQVKGGEERRFCISQILNDGEQIRIEEWVDGEWRKIKNIYTTKDFLSRGYRPVGTIEDSEWSKSPEINEVQEGIAAGNEGGENVVEAVSTSNSGQDTNELNAGLSVTQQEFTISGLGEARIDNRPENSVSADDLASAITFDAPNVQKDVKTGGVDKDGASIEEEREMRKKLEGEYEEKILSVKDFSELQEILKEMDEKDPLLLFPFSSRFNIKGIEKMSREGYFDLDEISSACGVPVAVRRLLEEQWGDELDVYYYGSAEDGQIIKKKAKGSQREKGGDVSGDKAEEANPSLELEEIKARLDDIRHKYVEEDYRHSSTVRNLMTTLGIKHVPFENPYAEEYRAALKAARAHDLADVQKDFGKVSPGELEKKLQGVLWYHKYSEAARLYEMAKEVKLAANADVNFARKALLQVQSLASGYRKMNWKKKIAIGAGVIGLGIAGGAAGGAAASVTGAIWAARRVITGTASFLAMDEMGNKLANKYAEKKDRKAADKEFSTIWNQEGKTDAEKIQKLFEALEQEDGAIETRLEKLKVRERRVKLAALATAVGLPIMAWGISDVAHASVEVSDHGEVSQVLQAEDAPTAPGEAPSGGVGVIPDPEKGDITFPTSLEDAEKTLGAAGVSSMQEIHATAPEAGAFGGVLEVTEAQRAHGLWGMLQDKLPADMPKAEQNRITASLQNLIQNKINAMSPEELRATGFHSTDINKIYPGDKIQLGSLVSQEELLEIQNGKIILPDGMANEAPFVEAVASGTEEHLSQNVDTGAHEVTAGGNGDATGGGEAYQGKQSIGFRGEPPTPEEQYWRGVQEVQGNARDSFRIPVRADEHFFENGDTYTYEMSDYRTLLSEPGHDQFNIPMLQRESIASINRELWDIRTTEFGPGHQFTRLTMSSIEGQYLNKPVGPLLAMGNEYVDTRPTNYNDWLFQDRGRAIYLDNAEPRPTLGDGPDGGANEAMDRVATSYRNNIRSMANRAMQLFGPAAEPINTLERKETVQQYITRVATLVTRAKMKDPNFQFNF